MTDKYLNALVDLNNEDLSEKAWLIKYLELYNSTLNQPHNLPPIGRSMMVKGSMKLKFHEVYGDILREIEDSDS
ncbi:MAG: hypothetical protein R2730_05760 [Chitinophagales bacterium]